MRKLGDLVWVEDGTVVSARVRVADVRVEPTFRRRVQRTIARLEDDSGSIDATWFGRRFIERRLQVGGEVVVSGRVKHFGRKLTFDNPEFQAVSADDAEVLHAGRIVPVYPLTAGLTAARLRTAIREALDVAGHAYPEYLPGADHRRGGARPDRTGRSRRRTTRTPSRAATRRSAAWPSTSCSRSSSAWSSGDGSGSATRRRADVAVDDATTPIRASLVGVAAGEDRPSPSS